MVKKRVRAAPRRSPRPDLRLLAGQHGDRNQHDEQDEVEHAPADRTSSGPRLSAAPLGGRHGSGRSGRRPRAPDTRRPRRERVSSRRRGAVLPMPRVRRRRTRGTHSGSDGRESRAIDRPAAAKSGGHAAPAAAVAAVRAAWRHACNSSSRPRSSSVDRHHARRPSSGGSSRAWRPLRRPRHERFRARRDTRTASPARLSALQRLPIESAESIGVGDVAEIRRS